MNKEGYIRKLDECEVRGKREYYSFLHVFWGVVLFFEDFFIFGDFISAKFTQSAQQLLVVVPVAKQD